MRALESPRRALRAALVVASTSALALPFACGGGAPSPSRPLASSVTPAASSEAPSAPVASTVTSAPASAAPAPSAAPRSLESLCADASVAAPERQRACQRACEARVSSACVTLGDLHAAGPAGDATDEQAAEAYERGCAQGHAPACARWRALLDRLRVSCAAKTTKPCALHARLVAGARSATDDDRKGADASAKVGCDAKDGDACAARGELHAGWEPGAVHEPQALAAHVRACDLGRGASCCVAALLTETGRGTKADDARAAALRARAKKSGEPGCRSLVELAQELALYDGSSDALLSSQLGGSIDDVLGPAASAPSSSVGAPKPIASSSAPPPTTAPEVERVEASVKASGVADAEAVVTRNKWRFRSCFKRALAADPGAGGTIRVVATVGAAGRVTSGKASGGTPASLNSCLAASLDAVSFEPPAGGTGELVVTVVLVAKK